MEYGVKWWSMCAWRAKQMQRGEMPDAASTKSKSFLSWNLKQTDVDRQTTSSFQGEETQRLEEAILLTAGHSDKAASWWNREPDYQHLLGKLIFLIFSHIHHYSWITLLLSSAFELLISLFVKMTLAAAYAPFPIPQNGSQLSPTQLIWQQGGGYHSDCCDSSTLAYSWRVSFHRCIKIPLTPFS